MRLSTFIPFTPIPEIGNTKTLINILSEGSYSQFLDVSHTPLYKQINSSQPILKIKIRHKKTSTFSESLNDVLFLDHHIWDRSVSASSNPAHGNYIIFIPDNFNVLKFNTQISLDQIQEKLTTFIPDNMLSDVLNEALVPEFDVPNSFLFSNINHFYAIHKLHIQNYPLIRYKITPH